jgi:hypothetical protein
VARAEKQGVIYQKRIRTDSGTSMDAFSQRLRGEFNEQIDFSIKREGFKDPPYVEIPLPNPTPEP